MVLPVSHSPPIDRPCSPGFTPLALFLIGRFFLDFSWIFLLPAESCFSIFLSDVDISVRPPTNPGTMSPAAESVRLVLSAVAVAFAAAAVYRALLRMDADGVEA